MKGLGAIGKSEVARTWKGRLAVRVRLLRFQSDPAPKDHGADGSVTPVMSPGSLRSASGGRLLDGLRDFSAAGRLEETAATLAAPGFLASS